MFENMTEAEILRILMPLVIFSVVFCAIFMVYGITMYILRGVAIYKMSAARGLRNGWLGFIPYAMDYQLGQIAGEIELGNKRIKNTGLWLLIMPIIYGGVFAVGYLITLVPTVLKLISLGDDPTAEEFFSVFPILLISILIFAAIILVAQIFLYLFKYLALHKIFSQYSKGQKPVYYLILAMFVPCAEEILLFRHRNRSLLPPENT